MGRQPVVSAQGGYLGRQRFRGGGLLGHRQLDHRTEAPGGEMHGH